MGRSPAVIFGRDDKGDFVFTDKSALLQKVMTVKVTRR